MDAIIDWSQGKAETPEAAVGNEGNNEARPCLDSAQPPRAEFELDVECTRAINQTCVQTVLFESICVCLLVKDRAINQLDIF